METKLRIWRVVPTSETGAKAPYFFVETEEFKLEKAEIKAEKLAKKICRLSKFDNWNLSFIKLEVRKDVFGRYWEYHQ